MEARYAVRKRREALVTLVPGAWLPGLEVAAVGRDRKWPVRQ